MARKVMWRDTGRTLRFLGVDGRALALLLLFVYNMAYWTLFVAFAGIIVLVILERMGYTIPNALRRLRVWLLGPHRPAVLRSRRGRMHR